MSAISPLKSREELNEFPKFPVRVYDFFRPTEWSDLLKPWNIFCPDVNKLEREVDQREDEIDRELASYEGKTLTELEKESKEKLLKELEIVKAYFKEFRLYNQRLERSLKHDQNTTVIIWD